MSKYRFKKNRSGLTRTCGYCLESFVEKDSFGASACDACLNNIEYLQHQNSHPTFFYQKIRFIVKYTYRSDNDSYYYNNDGQRVYDYPRSETLFMLVPKIIKNEDIREDNTVDNDHPIIKYLDAAGLLEGDHQKITTIRVRKLKDKINLE